MYENIKNLNSKKILFKASLVWSNLFGNRKRLGLVRFECTKCKAVFNSFFNIFSFFMHFFWEWHLALYILSDFPSIRNLSRLKNLKNLSASIQPHFTKTHTEIGVFIKPDTKTTNCGLLMWDGSSKIHYLLIFGTLPLRGCGGCATSKK